MLGFARKKDSVRAKTPLMISDEKLEKLLAILATVGLDDPDRWDFRSSIRNPGSFFGGMLEWSERSKDMRYYFDANQERIYNARVAPLSGSTNYFYSEKVIAKANEDLANLFAEVD